MINVNETHDPNLKSWIESANAPDTDFPIQNLPFCMFIHPEHKASVEGIIIGDFVLELLTVLQPLNQGRLIEDNEFREWMLQIAVYRKMFFTDKEKLLKLRYYLVELLRNDCSNEKREILKKGLFPVSEIEFVLPTEIGDYTDFYCSIFHAANVGSMFRPDNPLLPNYKWLPIGYHGRASSIVVSGTEIKRPKGQNRSDAEQPPVFIPCKNLDYEMEVGFFVGQGNNLGEPVSIDDAEKHIFGLCLVNDWSARDIQAWEYQPLGPFLAKNFATSVSPFVVTMEALAPFRTGAFQRPEGDPQPLDYLASEANEKNGGFDIKLEVYIQTGKMRAEAVEPFLLSRSNMKDLYWTIGQMLTHHASNGCNLQTGDLMATGTVSGDSKDSRGCLLELTWRGKEPIELPNGETRRFLEDGDEIIMKGFCEREGFRRIGFGTCRGIVLPAE
ncbi:MAG TPA: fumarylacetoacetase [Pyrinomonadaceae bacterium]